MMKKTMATAMFIISATAASAVTNLNNVRPDSIYRIENKVSIAEDTLLVTPLSQNPIFSYQNLIYKKRLDSLNLSVQMDYNEHVQNYIDLYVFGRKEQIGKMLGLSKYYFPIFERSLREVGVPDEIKFISIIESALNPNAVSKSGAVGPWQFMYTTAKGYGLVMDNYVDERKDPVQASYAAARYLKDAYNRFGDWLLAIAAYNCGAGAVSRAITRSGGSANFWAIRSYLPRETQNYVPAFIATAYAMNYYAKHDINPQVAGFNIFTDVIDVTRIISLSSVARVVEVDVKELKLLNPSYKKQIINGSQKSPKTLVIPVINKQLYSSLYDLLNKGIDNEPRVIAANNSEGSNPLTEGTTFHQVKEGQTLAMIANQYGVEVQDLKVWNDLKIVLVVPGQQIRVTPNETKESSPNSSSVYRIYIVKAGDTLSDIADKFNGVSITMLKAVNNLKSSVVQPGMRLKIHKNL